MRGWQRNHEDKLNAFIDGGVAMFGYLPTEAPTSSSKVEADTESRN